MNIGQLISHENLFGSAAVIVCLFQYVPYIKGTLSGIIKPHVFSWLVWTLLAGIAFVVQILKGAAQGAWVTGVTTSFCFMVFVLSLRRGEKEVTRTDWICLILGLFAVMLWVMTSDPLLAVIIVSIAYVIGLVPTWRKSITKPFEETLGVYLLGNVKWILSFFAYHSYNAAALLYPLTTLIASASLAVLLVIRRKRLDEPRLKETQC